MTLRWILHVFQSLLSTTAFGLGAKYFAFYEIEGVGVQWDNMAISPVEGDQYNLQLVILMMVFDALLYGLLTWYIEHVHPGIRLILLLVDNNCSFYATVVTFQNQSWFETVSFLLNPQLEVRSINPYSYNLAFALGIKCWNIQIPLFKIKLWISALFCIVILGSIGLPKPWYFPFTRSYWCGSHGHISDTDKHCTSEWWMKLCRCYRNLSVMEEDQACAMDDTQDGL